MRTLLRLYASRGECTSTAVYSDGPPVPGSCTFEQLLPGGTLVDDYGGSDIKLDNPGTVGGIPNQGCVGFTYSMFPKNSTLAFVDSAGNTWAMRNDSETAVVGTLRGSAYAPPSTWQAVSLSLSGSAWNGSTWAKDIEIALAGSYSANQSCIGGVDVTDGALAMDGSGIVS